MQLILRNPLVPFFGFLTLLLSGCGNDICRDSGGFMNQNGECVCEIYYSKNQCKSRWVDILANEQNSKYLIRIQYVGNGKGVQKGTSRSEDVTDGFRALNNPLSVNDIVLKDQKEIYIVKIPEFSIAIGIPNYPEKYSEFYSAEGCRFVSTPNEKSPIHTRDKGYSFKSVCEKEGIENIYWTNRHLEIVAIRTIRPEANLFINQDLMQ